MKKNVLLVMMICFIITIQGCTKEILEVNPSKISADGLSIVAATSNSVYVKGIYPFPNSVIGGDSFPVTVVLNQPAPSGGFRAYVKTIRLTGPIVDVPAYVTIPQGDSTGTINVHTIPVRYQEIPLFLVGPTSTILNFQYFINILPRPQNDPRPKLQFLEAENAILKGAHAVFGADPYFSNGGFVEYDKANGGSIEFNFSVKRTGNYFIVIKYATPSAYNLKMVRMKIELNDKKAITNFPLTANENSTQILNMIQPLKRGNNSLKITSVGKGIERIDYLEVAAQ